MEQIRYPLSNLSSAELLSRIEELVRTECGLTERITRHLAEIERRRLFATLGYSSLWDYAVQGLGYSGSAATRRIRVARAGVKRPRLYQYLEAGEVTLSSLEAAAELLLEEGGEALLETLRGRLKKEAELLCRRARPIAPELLRDKVELVAVASPPRSQQSLPFSSEAMEDLSGSTANASECNRGGRTEEELHRISFSAGSKFMTKLKRAQELHFSGAKEDLLLCSVLEEALDLYIAKHCPMERKARRDARAARGTEGSKEMEIPAPETDSAASAISIQPECAWEKLFPVPRPDLKRKQKPERPRVSGGRQIPVWMRDEVLARDGYRCTYVAPHGYRCECPVDLEIDHILPFALGGKTETENLRVMCRTHNMLEEICRFGSGFVERKIAEKDGEGPRREL